mgnify:CR=1 FL=1
MAGGLRRRWSATEKAAIVADARKPGRSVAIVARQNDVNANLLFRWMREATVTTEPEPAGFIPVEVTAEAEETEASPLHGVIAVDLPCGARVSCEGPVDEQALSSVFRALGRRP